MKQHKQAGFTLIEILAVLLILSVLMGILMTSLFNAGEAANAKMTRARMSQIETAMKRYETATGDFPKSSFDGLSGVTGTPMNRGIEAAVHAMFAEPHNGLGMSEDTLDNVDGDSMAGEPLFEFIDMWGNPIAYFRRQDYGKPQTYLTLDGETGEEIDNEVQARKSVKTGRWANAQTFQLISAGADGLFGTEDDLGNFEMQ